MRQLRFVLIAVSGAALSLAFPPFSLWPLAWVALVPLFIVARDSKPRTAALAGLAFGIGFFASLLYWIAIFGYLPWVLLTVMQALPLALFAALAAVVYRSRRPWLELAAIPALWTLFEWLRSLGPYGFTWGNLAYSQTPNLPAVQIASITGPWGLTFAIALFSTALAARKRMILLPFGVALVVAAAVHLGGIWSMGREAPKAEKLDVALVQGALDQDRQLTPERIEEAMRVYTELTMSAAESRPEFIIWPETVVPGDIVTSAATREWVSSLARSSGAHMLVGAPHDRPATAARPATQLNGAYMFSPDGEILGSYYKVHLVPFGEFVPARRWLPFLERYKVRDVDVRPGREHNLLPTAYGEAGVMICFESIFPAIARREARDGARILFVITNDGWFERTAAAAQHHDFSVFRAVETRRFVVRNAATGISSVIDPHGRANDHLDIWEPGVVYGEVEMRSGLTLYSRFGDWFVYLCAAIAAAGIGLGVMRRRERKPAGKRAK